MDVRKYCGTVFLKVDDVKDGPIRAKIVEVSLGQYDKLDLEFDDGSKMSVNATNGRTLINAYGADSDGWVDKEVELGPGQVKYNGKMQDSIIIRPISPPLEKSERKVVPLKPAVPAQRPDMDDEIPF
jgi:hypothetical protein